MNEIVSFSYLEKELRTLWEQVAEKNQNSDAQAVTRACVHNLVIYAQGENADAEVSSIVSEVTVQNPGRVMILLPNSNAGKDELNAWVTAQCYLTGGKRQQVCCEQIMIKGAGESIKRMSSLVAPLLVPDVPVFLWWRGTLDCEQSLLMDLLDAADRWIIDSSLFPDFRSACLCLQAKPDTYYALSDLNWSRITPWRSLIASLFDYENTRSHLNDLRRIEIKGSLKSGRPWLLACWLCSRLGFQSPERLQQDSSVVSFVCSSDNGRVEIELRNSERKMELESMRMMSAQNAEFSVQHAADETHLQAQIRIDNALVTRATQKFTVQTEAELLRRELLILSRDKPYEEALRFLQQLA